MCSLDNFVSLVHSRATYFPDTYFYMGEMQLFSLAQLGWNFFYTYSYMKRIGMRMLKLGHLYPWPKPPPPLSPLPTLDSIEMISDVAKPPTPICNYQHCPGLFPVIDNIRDFSFWPSSSIFSTTSLKKYSLKHHHAWAFN